MTFESFGRCFGVRPAIIQAQIELAKSSVGAPGRPALLSATTKEWLENMIRTRLEKWKPVTYAEVLDSLQRDRQVVLTTDTLRYITRHIESVKAIIGRPMEAGRVAVDPDAVSAWFERLNSMVDGVPRKFLFNMDETGCSYHHDSLEVRVIVPIDDAEPPVPVPFDRYSTCSLSWRALPPMCSE
jgi:hypothetical protein